MNVKSSTATTAYIVPYVAKLSLCPETSSLSVIINVGSDVDGQKYADYLNGVMLAIYASKPRRKICVTLGAAVEAGGNCYQSYGDGTVDVNINLQLSAAEPLSVLELIAVVRALYDIFYINREKKMSTLQLAPNWSKLGVEMGEVVTHLVMSDATGLARHHCPAAEVVLQLIDDNAAAASKKGWPDGRWLPPWTWTREETQAESEKDTTLGILFGAEMQPTVTVAVV